MNQIKNNQKKKIVAVIACRLNSSRLFGKPLQLIDEKNCIIEILVKQLKKVKDIEGIILAISEKPGNEIFIEIAKNLRIKYVIGSENNVLKRIIKGADLGKATDVLRVTSEDPCKSIEIINSAIKSHKEKSVDLTLPIGLPNGVGFEIIRLDSLKNVLKKANKKELEHVTLYHYNHFSKFKIHKFQIPKKFQRPEIRLTIDNPSY